MPLSTTLANDGKHKSFPAVLIAAPEQLLNALADLLRQGGYLVFEARNKAEALNIVIGQSRLIHILLADINMDGHALATTLERYRPEMKALFVTAHLQQGFSEALTPSMVAAKIRDILILPEGIAQERCLKASAA